MNPNGSKRKRILSRRIVRRQTRPPEVRPSSQLVAADRAEQLDVLLDQVGAVTKCGKDTALINALRTYLVVSREARKHDTDAGAWVEKASAAVAREDDPLLGEAQRERLIREVRARLPVERVLADRDPFHDEFERLRRQVAELRMESLRHMAEQAMQPLVLSRMQAAGMQLVPDVQGPADHSSPAALFRKWRTHSRPGGGRPNGVATAAPQVQVVEGVQAAAYGGPNPEPVTPSAQPVLKSSAGASIALTPSAPPDPEKVERGRYNQKRASVPKVMF